MNYIKKIIKAVLSIAVIIAIIAGAVIGVKYFIGNTDAPASDIYKEETKRNSKYNGVYTLTKLDEDGNNTWDGLICYVKNDKIIEAGIVDYVSCEELVKEAFGEDTDIKATHEQTDDLALKKITGLELGSVGGNSSFGISGTAIVDTNNGFTIGKMSFEAYTTKLSLDDKDVYNTLYKSGLLAGYDEDSQEVWLSKLLSNEASEYHEGYKLIHYSSEEDMSEKCEINNGYCFDLLNTDYNAGL